MFLARCVFERLRLACLGMGLLIGCSSPPAGSSSGDFPLAPYTTFTTDQGEFSVALWTAPSQPPSRGVNRVKLAVADATTGTPQSALDIGIVPWMPAMGHGTSVVPTVTEQSDGVYVAENVNFFMAGNWQLRITFSSQGDGATGVTDGATPTFDIH
jgi:hypothetical protein